jgi:glyoxylase-like metal-dependent hydrolase (beta-lactamase superfamily II)
MNIYPISCGFGMAFLIEGPHGLFLVDSGSPGNEGQVMAKMRALRRQDLKVIWITHAHYDHYGSTEALRRLTGAKVGVHAADAESLASGQSPIGTTRGRGFLFPLVQPVLNRFMPLPRTQADFTLGDGETLEAYGLDAKVLHTPGHTPGHTCLVLESGIVFAGDLLGGFPKPGLQNLLATDWSQLPGSLAALRATQPKWIYTGHRRGPVDGNVIRGGES